MEFKWEDIDSELQRAKVPGGWLVKMYTDVMHDVEAVGFRDGWDWRPALTFVPDPTHSWGVVDEPVSAPALLCQEDDCAPDALEYFEV